jgi:transcriptional regulator with XRE-family HTH domain
MMKLNEYRNQLEESKEYTNAKRELKLHFALADAVLRARTNKGWTQKELAKEIGTKQANISRIESGLANPTLEFLTRLSTVLDFDIGFSCEYPLAVQFVIEPKKESLRNLYTGAESFPNTHFDYDLSIKLSKTREEKVCA